MSDPQPKCGHSACRQNWIDTGNTKCVLGQVRFAPQTEAGLQSLFPPDVDEHGYVIQCPLCGSTRHDGECDNCGADE